MPFVETPASAMGEENGIPAEQVRDGKPIRRQRGWVSPQRTVRRCAGVDLAVDDVVPVLWAPDQMVGTSVHHDVVVGAANLGVLRLPGKVTVAVVWSRDLPSDPTSVRVYSDNLGHWYASFVVRREATAPAEADGSAIGIDWGVKVTATTTDTVFDLPHLGHRKRCAAERAKAQRRMARRRRPQGTAASKGYLRAKRQAARIEKKAARQNTHDARQWARRVVDAHHLIAVEDFKPKFLARSTMARKAADAAVGACKRELIYRGVQAVRTVVLVPPAYTTMTCSECGTRAKERLGLGIRTFECSICGYTADRDLNAARTILATAERVRASADDVRHSSASFRDGGSDAVRAGNPPDSSVGNR